MGDTGSLTLGGILAVFAILIRKELLIPLLCLIFFIEDLSVILRWLISSSQNGNTARGCEFSR